MFTGIIKEIGRIRKITNKSGNMEIEIQCQKTLRNLNNGDSISVNGVCLTVTSLYREGFDCDISFNTLNISSLKYLKVNDAINLESSLTPTDKLGGHLVYGHVDCTGKILKISRIGDSHIINIEFPSSIREFIAPKGSVTIDGISLTISEVKNDNLSAFIIPYTYENTNLSQKNPGDIVNIEVDMLARYIINFIQTRNAKIIDSQESKNKALEEKLKKYGFTK